MNSSVFFTLFPVLILFGVIWLIKTVNKLRRYRVIIQESKKNVDIALAKRYDTISQMIKVARSFARHEKSTFSDLIALRGGLSIREFNSTIQKQDQTIGKIYALAESYPELRSSEEFLALQREIDEENEQLAAAKRIVNNNISILNQEIVTFPTSVVARLSGIDQTEFLTEETLDTKKTIHDFDYEV